MKKTTVILSAALATSIGIGAAFAGSHVSREISGAIKARQSHMQLYLHNLIPLAMMVRDRMPYDADVAATAAGNIAKLATVSQSRYWPPGSDSDAVPESNALPAIWQEGSRTGEIGMEFAAAAQTLGAEAGNGLDALKAAFGPMNEGCNTCHESYQKPN